MTMWPFDRQIALAGSGVFRGFTDWHSHILPGVDDGVQTMDEALAILAEYERSGVRKVWLTPHIMEDMPNTPADLKKRFEILKSEYNGNIALHLAAENMIDSLFEDRLDRGDLLPYGRDGNMLLVETSYFNPPVDLYTMLDRIRAKGYFPVLAHPERYAYMSENEYDRLKRDGIYFQINLPSLTCFYGSYVRKKAGWLLKKGYADMFGTDIHSLRLFRNITGTKLSQKTISYIEKNKF